jgi:hypothetical protein
MNRYTSCTSFFYSIVIAFEQLIVAARIVHFASAMLLFGGLLFNIFSFSFDQRR